MTDETNVAEAANDTVMPAVEAQPEANEAPAAEQPSDAELSLDERLSAKFDEMNAPEETGVEAKADDATVEGEETPPEEGGEEKVDQPMDTAGEQSDVTAIAMPVTWSKEMAELWATSDPQIQEYVSQRELETQQSLSKQGNELARARPIVEVVSKYQQHFDRHGVTFEQGLQSLMNAQMMLDQDAMKGIAMIAQTYGIDLPKAFGPEAQQMDPVTRQLLEDKRRLEAQVQNSQRDQHAQRKAAERAAEEQADSKIAEWLESGDKPYFDRVEAAMVALIQTNQTSDLDTAYDMACHADPAIRAELLEAQRAAEQAKADEEARKKAQEEQLAAARVAKEAKRKASTNGGNRANMTTVPGAFLDDDAMAARFDQIVAG